MKQIMIVSLAAIAFTTMKVYAQVPGKANEKMNIFSGWVGHWRGEGYLYTGPGEPKKSTVNEHIETRLDGTLLIVEGIGKSTDASTQQETVVHHAFAVLSYDQHSGNYNFKTYLSDGHSADAWLEVVAENKFRWGFDSPRGKTRYNIQLDPLTRTWSETGEFSADGTSWRKFFEMNLTKVD